MGFKAVHITPTDTGPMLTAEHVSDIPRPNKYRFSMFNSVCQHLSVQCELELFLESGKALIFKYLALSASAREILFSQPESLLL